MTTTLAILICHWCRRNKPTAYLTHFFIFSLNNSLISWFQFPFLQRLHWWEYSQNLLSYLLSQIASQCSFVMGVAYESEGRNTENMFIDISLWNKRCCNKIALLSNIDTMLLTIFIVGSWYSFTNSNQQSLYHEQQKKIEEGCKKTIHLRCCHRPKVMNFILL